MRLTIPLKQEVAAQLPWLFQELDFRVVEDHYDPQNFGNSFVTLESPRFRVRFVRDRGQVFAEVASPSDPNDWWPLVRVCEVIFGRSVELGFDLPAIGALLRNNFSALADCLGPKFPETKRELERRAQQRK